ncbi:MAG: DNA-processing protein DprA, partial [Clostridiales bacterium]|nr:DNA-processing protein DprA [Clostridiales bacterium]
MDDLIYLLWLTRVDGLGPKKQKELLRRFANAQEIYHASGVRLRDAAAHAGSKLTEQNLQSLQAARDLRPVENLMDDARKKNIQVLTLEDAAYPSLLKEISDPPLILYMMGTMPDDSFPKVSLIGARRCSEYG